MSADLHAHSTSIKLTELPDEIAGCADCLAIGGSWVHLRMCQSAGRSAAATARRTGTRRVTPARPAIRSSAPPSRARTGAGATSTRSPSWSRRADAAASCTSPTGARRRTRCTCTARSSARSGSPRRRRATTGGTSPLYVDVRGLTTRRLHHAGTTFEITLDFVDHALVVQHRRRAQPRRSACATGCRRRVRRRACTTCSPSSASTSRSGSSRSASR